MDCKMLLRVSILVLVVSHVELRLLVHTEVGSIRGVPADDGDYAMFLGIPYAKVNISNPFGPSIPQEKFEKVYEAVTESAICPQIRESAKAWEDPYGGTLDCLRLNVYVPNSETKDKAVYLYIFGGRFVSGSSLKKFIGPKYLVRHDIIVITLNYRLGPYGFMCMDIPEIPGNQGLWDQYKAIKWARDNIRAFGGDPQKMTIGGHSSGSQLVDLHLLTKQPRLFQQAILQSGTTTNLKFLQPNTMRLINIAYKLSFKTNDTYAALSFLAKTSPEIVIKETEKDDWKPCVEKGFEGVDPFIVENPELSESTINIDGLNILGGLASRECLYFLYRSTYKPLFTQPDTFRYVLESNFNFQNDSNLVDASIINYFYLEDNRNRISNTYKIVDFLSDYYYVHPVQRQLIKYSKHRNTNVYLYLFSYDGEINYMKRILNVTEAGVTHGDELSYIFTMDAIIHDIQNSEDRRKIDQMTTLWTNFIKYGNPTPHTTELLPVTWPPLSAGSVPCLQIDTNLSLIWRPFHKSFAFWDLFYNVHFDKFKN